jgi:alkyl sulfatase BDS1-like metallo-beta-lactamase superfamily hydrolase
MPCSPTPSSDRALRYFRRAIVTGVSLALASTAVEAQVAPKAAEPATSEANGALLRTLPFADRQDFDDAMRGFLGTRPDAQIAGSGPRPVWSMKPYDFVKQEVAPDTVNPSLWRQARLNSIHGLFKVTDRVYQVRGFDISNLTIIEGDTSLIIIDATTTAQTAKAGIELYYQYRPRMPIGALVYSHNHADHFGGVKGIISEADVASGKIQLLAPTGFMDAVMSESIIAGTAMSRRSLYQFGVLLPRGPRGHVDSGLGKGIARGSLTLIPPNATIDKVLETRTIDGVDIVFKLVPGSEAPTEMLMYFPQFRVLDMAEDVTHTLHNLYAIRGAEVRDGNLWSRYISDALETFGDKTDVLIAQHHWPVAGQTRVIDLLKKQRDLYKFISDQSLRLANKGLNPDEIAETLRLPQTLQREWSARGYYGTVRHNAKAVYQKYLGWYDGNPADLDPLPAVESARKTIDYMGGADAVIVHARTDFAKGEYRWVASVMKQVVFAEPTNRAARELGADAMEQLAYQAESATWRNAYLQGASELRNGTPNIPGFSTANADTLKAISNAQVFDLLGTRLNADKAEGKRFVINWSFTDSKQQLALTLENSALTYVSGKQALSADTTISLARSTLDEILMQQTTLAGAAKAGLATIEGDAAKLDELLSMLDTFKVMFEIVEPKRTLQ